MQTQAAVELVPPVANFLLVLGPDHSPAVAGNTLRKHNASHDRVPLVVLGTRENLPNRREKKATE